MKDTFTDANFPKTADGRVYHLGLRVGEVANRIITVGSSSRAESISQLLDSPSTAFKLASERGFLTITGRYNDVPISIVSIGMGYPNMDFFVREARECLVGDMVIIRLGSCGGLTDLSVGSVVVPSASVSITRNYDFNFGEDEDDKPSVKVNESPYIVSRPIKADEGLHAALASTLLALRPTHLSNAIEPNVVNASADSFYSSQGRQTSFPDHNVDLIQRLVESVPGLGCLEMETFHLFHLASVWRPPKTSTSTSMSTSVPSSTSDSATVPPTHFAATTTTTPSGPSSQGLNPPTITSTLASTSDPISPPPATESESKTEAKSKAINQPPHKPTHHAISRIRAASAQMIFASRLTQAFISPAHVEEVQAWAGRAVLETLAAFGIVATHEERGSVWERRV